ncbi:isoamylase early set domain-containing protein [Flavobacterium crassostreae]|uniref:Glycoside hydrolase n=1 Tax=Flavobacterium crassostreae TaxID=1763534 RepID=A0A1B9DZR9_9FLAO|nr:isoamylase early set domain-containing protein [Flavobacterium crassostreae]OCB75181.1 glycoside hydrolase [Flavobacterium crassostreae]
MALKKRFLKSKPICKVTFVIAENTGIQAAVVGDFNGWDAQLGTLKKFKNGNFKGVFDICVGKSYEFRYVVDGVYSNEPEADFDIWNDHAAAKNSVLVV